MLSVLGMNAFCSGEVDHGENCILQVAEDPFRSSMRSKSGGEQLRPPATTSNASRDKTGFESFKKNLSFIVVFNEPRISLYKIHLKVGGLFPNKNFQRGRE